MKLKQILAFCAVVPVLFLSCKGDIQDATASIKSITYFKIGELQGQIDQDRGEIIVLIPQEEADSYDIENLTAQAEFDGASISPSPNVARSYKVPVLFSVFAKDQSKKEYIVKVEQANNESNSITTFRLAGKTASISWPNISVTVPYGTDITSIAPFVQHSGMFYSPVGPQDFTQSVEYTVTSVFGDQNKYNVTVLVEKGTTQDINSFRIVGPIDEDSGEHDWAVEGVIDQVNKTIAVTVPYRAAGMSFTPEVGYNGVSYDPAGVQDFSNPVEYKIMSEAGGAPKIYTVTVTKAAATDCTLSAFMIGGSLETTINQTTGEINVTVLYGTDIASITPGVSHSGASYIPAGPQDFSNSNLTPITYTVTAADPAYEKDYFVTVTVAPSHFKQITSFIVNDIPGDIEETDDQHGFVNLTLPYNSKKNALLPVITISSLANLAGHNGPNVSGKVDFTNPVTYTITAENGTSREYLVTIDIALNSAKQLKTFNIAQQTVGTSINEAAGTVLVEVPKYIDRAHLAPTIAHTGASIEPASGAEMSFTSPVKYTVTAANGSKKEYMVTVIGTVVTPPINASTPGYTVSGKSGDIYNLFDHAIGGYGSETHTSWAQVVWDETIGSKEINRVRIWTTNGCTQGVYITFFEGAAHTPITNLPTMTPPGTTSPTGAASVAAKRYYPAVNAYYVEINLSTRISVTGVRFDHVLKPGWGVHRPLQMYLDLID